MEHGAAQATGWVVNTTQAWVFVGSWVAVVLVYGFWRSRGEAAQDAIRPSGPTE
jgi:hypothetical protein